LWSGCSREAVCTRQRPNERAQQLIAASFFALAVYITADSIRTVVGGTHPETSWVGIGLAAVIAVTRPLLALAKRRVGNRLHSAATVKQASQTTLCAYLSIALLVGLLANALAGWSWADRLVAYAARASSGSSSPESSLRTLLTRVDAGSATISSVG
jgi:divalent metal cation (Fe/Co/Zn/Cd) transporter